MPRAPSRRSSDQEDWYAQRERELAQQAQELKEKREKRERLTRNMIKYVVGLVVVLFVMLFLFPVGLKNVAPTEGAVVVHKISHSVDPEPLTVGYHIYNRWATDIEKYDIATKAFPDNVGESEKSNEYTMELKTSDGQNVNVDMTLLKSLRLKELPALHQKVGINYENEILLPQMRSEARLAFGAYAAEDIYQGKVREQIQMQVLQKLQESLAKTNTNGELMYPAINISDVLVRHLSFSPDFEKAIEQKKLASQQVEINKQLALAEEEKAKQMEAVAKGEKLKVVQQAMGKSEASQTEAQGEAAAIKLKADAEQYKLECEAKGNLAKYTAEAEGKRLSAAALAGPGGDQVVQLEYAKNIPPTMQTYAYPAGANISVVGGNFLKEVPKLFGGVEKTAK
jgi:regulator of protease activity HflC (stomatin/prohibitin superfamily)